jgi:TPR repeat protein
MNSEKKQITAEDVLARMKEVMRAVSPKTAPSDAAPKNLEPQIPKLKDEAEAFELLNKGADTPSLIAVTNLALRLLYGYEGTPVDTLVGKWLLNEAASRGHSPAQYYLGLELLRHLKAGPEVFGHAADLLRRAADSGHIEAALTIGSHLRSGWCLPIDLAESRKYYALAAKLDSPEGMRRFGEYCRDGIGGPRDLVQAEELFKSASAYYDTWTMLGPCLFGNSRSRRRAWRKLLKDGPPPWPESS